MASGGGGETGGDLFKKSFKESFDRSKSGKGPAYAYIWCPLLFYFIFRFLVILALRVSPIFGLAFSGFLIVFIGLALFGYSHQYAKHATLTLAFVLTLYGTSFLLGIAGFSGLSLGLYRKGLASFASTGPMVFDRMAYHYFWHALDMVPALDIWKTLKVDDPVQSVGTTSGLCLIAFRAMIMLPFLALVKGFLDYRRKKLDQEAQASPTAGQDGASLATSVVSTSGDAQAPVA